MKPHRTDGVSLSFGLIFLMVAVWWAVSRVVTLHLPAVGWVVAGGLIVRNMSKAGCCGTQKTAADTITCRPHDADSGRYWFFTSWRQPIACEASRKPAPGLVLRAAPTRKPPSTSPESPTTLKP